MGTLIFLRLLLASVHAVCACTCECECGGSFCTWSVLCTITLACKSTVLLASLPPSSNDDFQIHSRKAAEPSNSDGIVTTSGFGAMKYTVYFQSGFYILLAFPFWIWSFVSGAAILQYLFMSHR